MRIAVVGGGVSGLVAAYLLQREHEVTLFEAAAKLGGHTNTVRVDTSDATHYVDTGFMVFNDHNYPNFQRLLDRLGVAWQPSQMSFGVSDTTGGFEYASTNPNGLFATRSHIVSPRFHRMLADVRRFQRQARELLLQEREDFDNHGVLHLRDRPKWRTVTRGSERYVAALIAPFRERVRAGLPVQAIERHPDHHEILRSMRYQPNETVLHTDERLLPRRRRAWASWNYHLVDQPDGKSTVTYHMNRLQELRAEREFCVTLNRTEAIDPSKIIKTMEYSHPVHTAESALAQQRHREISGTGRTHYCGAYWGWGFHEDGVVSALRACERLGARLT